MTELDDLLEVLRSERPRPTDVARWQAALRRVGQRKTSRWVELAAAMLVGVLIGGALFNRPAPEENLAEPATIEHVITKIE